MIKKLIILFVLLLFSCSKITNAIFVSCGIKSARSVVITITKIESYQPDSCFYTFVLVRDDSVKSDDMMFKDATGKYKLGEVLFSNVKTEKE